MTSYRWRLVLTFGPPPPREEEVREAIDAPGAIRSGSYSMRGAVYRVTYLGRLDAEDAEARARRRWPDCGSVIEQTEPL